MNVLLVDDDPDSQYLLKTYLETAGFSVDLAENGRIALERLTKRSYQAVITDVQMPEIDGMVLTRSIRRMIEMESVSIIGLSGGDHEAEMLAAGASHYFLKPLDPGLLIEALRLVLMSRELPS